MSDKFFVGLDLTGFSDNGTQRPISRVTLLLDDTNSLTAGDDTGMELVADCPHATQEMVNSILSQVKGAAYRMFTAENARLDPSAELGDGITAGRVYSVISRLSDDGSGFSGITSPGEAEMEDEYPAAGPMTQAFNRQIAETRSSITKTAEQIRLEVANEIEGLSSSITVEIDKITQEIKGVEGNVSTLQQTATSLSTKISGVEENVSTLEQYVDSFTISVSNGDYSSTLRLMAGRTTLASETIEFTGMVTFSDLTGNKTIIDGGVIDTSTLYLDTLYGGTIYLCDSGGRIGAEFDITGSAAQNGRGLVLWSGEIKMHSYTAPITLDAIDAKILLWSGIQVECNSDFIPTYDDRNNIGNSRYAWRDLYIMNDPIVYSDREKKKDIVYGLMEYDVFFDSLLPVKYKLVDGQSGRTHVGFISQDVEQALNDTGLTDMDFAGFIRSPHKDDDENIIDGEYDYALRYGEFIALCVEQIQQLKKRVSELEKGGSRWLN